MPNQDGIFWKYKVGKQTMLNVTQKVEKYNLMSFSY